MTAAVTARTLRLGTRRSALALAQAGQVAEALRADGHDVQLVEVVTEGDRSAAALTMFGGTGVFVAELRQRLDEHFAPDREWLAREADVTFTSEA